MRFQKSTNELQMIFISRIKRVFKMNLMGVDDGGKWNIVDKTY